MKQFLLLLALVFVFVSCEKDNQLTNQDIIGAEQITDQVTDDNINSVIPYHDIDYVTNYKKCNKWGTGTSINGIKVYLTDLTKYWYPQGTIGVYRRDSPSDDWVLVKTQSYSSPNPYINIFAGTSIFPNSGPEYMAYGVGTSGSHPSTYPADLLPAGGVTFTMNKAGLGCGIIQEVEPAKF